MSTISRMNIKLVPQGGRRATLLITMRLQQSKGVAKLGTVHMPILDENADRQ